MKTILSLILVLSALPAFAGPRETAVTQAEAAAVFAKTEQVIKGVLQLKNQTPGFPKSGSVATREQILKHFDSIFKLVEPKFKFLPPKRKTAPTVVTVKDANAKRILLKLEGMGFIDRYGPLATSKNPGLQPAEFGDALGYFMARIAELTHTPSRKFSPYLMPPG